MKHPLRLAALAFTATVSMYGQYAGPAILSRGEAPASITAPTIRFRPFVSVAESYDTGLASVKVDDNGQLANTASVGTRLGWGVSGSHRWRHTSVGMSYLGSFTVYRHNDAATGIDQSLLLSFSHAFSPRLRFTTSESAGMFTRNYTGATLSQTVQFDPSQSNIPLTDFFDNRTIYLSSDANLTYQRTARLSFSFGGNNVTDVRHSRALANALIVGAHGDAQYRISKRMTLGGVYRYNTFHFSRVSGSTDMHSVAGSFSYGFSARSEFSVYAGASRVESKFIQTTAIDPNIAALLQITAAPQIYYTIGTQPMLGSRISRRVHNGVVYGGAMMGVSAGNGLFLTSYEKSAIAGYSYTGLRRWSATMTAASTWSHAAANITGDYQTTGATMGVARKLGSYLHLTLNGSARKYNSATFGNYNRLIYTFSGGLTFSPGELPLRMW